MALEHRLKPTDTLHSLAVDYFDDASRWRDIAEFNQLHAPYITEDRDHNRYASGFVTIRRENFTSELTIPVGWSFHTKPSIIGGTVKRFINLEETVIPAGTDTAYCFVECTEPGTFGNIDARVILEPGIEFEKSNVRITSVINERAFTNGTDAKYAVIGDILYIPTEATETRAPQTLQRQLELLGGEDLYLAVDDAGHRYIPADGYDDLATVSGIRNIVQAVNDRLTTEKGDLPFHPEYGTNLPLLIGGHRTPFTPKLVELEIYDALSNEDRITDLEVRALALQSTSVAVELGFRPALSDRAITLNITLDFTRG